MNDVSEIRDNSGEYYLVENSRFEVDAQMEDYLSNCAQAFIQ